MSRLTYGTLRLVLERAVANTTVHTWSRNMMARDEDGNACEITSPNARRHCFLSRAALELWKEMGRPEDLRPTPGLIALGDVTRAINSVGYHTAELVRANDAHGYAAGRRFMLRIIEDVKRENPSDEISARHARRY